MRDNELRISPKLVNDPPIESTPSLASQSYERSEREDELSSTRKDPERLIKANLSWLPERVLTAISRLLDASIYAVDLGEDPWEFAIELGSFRDLGLTRADWRWLTKSGLVEYATEEVPSGQSQRCFRPCDDLQSCDSACFILSPAGFKVSRALFSKSACGELLACQASGGDASNMKAASAWSDFRRRSGELQPNGFPAWDRDRMELRVAGLLVKRFRAPAPNQEAILAAFQEENWPTRIDDPLSPSPDLEPKRRLHDTINSLNRNQRNRLLRFLGDGSGEGVRWEFLQGTR